MTNPDTRVENAVDAPPGQPANGREILDAVEEHGDLRDGDSWGPWTWNDSAQTLDYSGPGYEGHPYGVDVEEILHADDPDAEAWDWVRHVAEKRWDPPAIRCLVLALRTVLRQLEGGER